MATFGWCSTEKPAVFTLSSPGGPFLEVILVSYRERTSAFSISSLPLSFLTGTSSSDCDMLHVDIGLVPFSL